MLQSEILARTEQYECLGIYRAMDFRNGRPVYKQDEGQNYLYYHNDSWLIGPHSHKGDPQYAWIRSKREDVGSSSSSSSSSSDSDSDADSIGSAGSLSSGSRRKRRQLKKKAADGTEIRTPDQLERGQWQYRLSVVVNGPEENENWHDDDTLQVEALKGIDKHLYTTVVDSVNKTIWSVVLCCDDKAVFSKQKIPSLTRCVQELHNHAMPTLTNPILT